MSATNDLFINDARNTLSTCAKQTDQYAIYLTEMLSAFSQKKQYSEALIALWIKQKQFFLERTNSFRTLLLFLKPKQNMDDINNVINESTKLINKNLETIDLLLHQKIGGHTEFKTKTLEYMNSLLEVRDNLSTTFTLQHSLQRIILNLMIANNNLLLKTDNSALFEGSTHQALVAREKLLLKFFSSSTYPRDETQESLKTSLQAFIHSPHPENFTAAIAQAKLEMSKIEAIHAQKPTSVLPHVEPQPMEMKTEQTQVAPPLPKTPVPPPVSFSTPPQAEKKLTNRFQRDDLENRTALKKIISTLLTATKTDIESHQGKLQRKKEWIFSPLADTYNQFIHAKERQKDLTELVKHIDNQDFSFKQLKEMFKDNLKKYQENEKKDRALGGGIIKDKTGKMLDTAEKALKSFEAQTTLPPLPKKRKL